MIISLVAAMARNRVIGSQGKIPWQLPADLKHFKELTYGHPVIMGRKTYESIGKPLSGRKNIVISREPDFRAEGCIVSRSFEEALESAKSSEEVFVIGGGQIYKLALPYAGKIYLTVIDAEIAGDTFFPKFDESEWQLVNSESHQSDEKNPYNYRFLVYEKKTG